MAMGEGGVFVFAELVRAYRQRLGFTQDELAGKTGLSVRNIRNLEGGRTSSPRPATVRLLADAFGLAGAERESFCQAASNPPAAPVAERRRVPAQLPADVAGFTGREEQLVRLDELLREDADSGTAVVISAIAGTAGVGKTALAITWGHRVASRFPDGQLYVNLRGYDPGQPMAPDDALAGFLAALGVAGPEIPVELPDRAARYRSEVAGARMLVVLDNAGSVEQVRPLLPGSGSCAVVVTSRDSLAGLVAVDGAHRIDLDLLPLEDALRMLRRLIGPRVDADPQAAVVLAEQCARLPLALRVAAELAASRPTIPLAALVTELADLCRRLELLEAGGDPHAAVRVVFSWSIRYLPPEAAALFQVLGLHPGPDLDPYAAAALAGADLDTARHMLDLLARAHLIHPTGAGRYGMHDLLRAYATHLCETHTTDQERRTALGRLLDYYLVTAATAMDSWAPADVRQSRPVPALVTAVPDLTDPDGAVRWLDAERPCLVAAAVHAAVHGWPTHTIRLSTILYRYLDGCHYTDALAVHGHALRSAEHTGDLAGQANALLHLGSTYRGLGRLEQAIAHNRHARDMARRAGDLTGEAGACNGLGNVEILVGNHRAALGHYRQALAAARRAGNTMDEAKALTNLGSVEERLGRYHPAAERHRQALALGRQAGDSLVQAMSLNNLGLAEMYLGRHRIALDYYRQALALARQLGHRRGEAVVLDSIGTLHLRLDQPAQATEHLTHALTISREVGDRTTEAEALNGLAEAADSVSDTLAHHAAAMAAAASTGARSQLARAHAGLGDAHRAAGDIAQARTHYQEALAIYTDLDMPLADDVRERLAALG